MSAAIGNVLGLVLAMQSAAAAPPAELEVVGRLTNLDYEGVDEPDDLLGHGWITATLRISRVVRGHPPSRTLTIRYLAHTYRSERRSVRLRLRLGSGGVYLVCAGPHGGGVTCG